MPALRHNLRFRLVGAVSSRLLRALHATWRIEVLDPPGALAGAKEGSRPAVIAFWHRHILTMMTHYRGGRVCVPVSRSDDGEYVAHVMERFGLQSVRGSTSRGSIPMLRQWLSMSEQGYSPVITPDGPRGPRFSVQPGVVLVARRTGLPVHPVGIAVRNAWTLPSWDAFVVPKPGTCIVIAAGRSLRAEDFADAQAFCEALREALFDATELALRRLGHAGSIIPPGPGGH